MSEAIERINAELKARGWTRADLARHLGYSEQRLMNWWKRGIPAGEYARLASVLGWAGDRLITGRPEADSPTPPPENHTQLGAEIDAIMAKATPRSRLALEHIAAAAGNGELSEDDLIMLEQIAKRFQSPGKKPDRSGDKIKGLMQGK